MLGSPGGESLQLLAPISSGPPLALQDVSACNLSMSFISLDLWFVSAYYLLLTFLLTLLPKLTLGCLGGECILFLSLKSINGVLHWISDI